jgi:hypothetical protein
VFFKQPHPIIALGLEQAVPQSSRRLPSGSVGVQAKRPNSGVFALEIDRARGRRESRRGHRRGSCRHELALGGTEVVALALEEAQRVVMPSSTGLPSTARGS